MANNVLILGAGFSCVSGIPLLGGFVEKMWEFAARKSINGTPLSKDDLEIFNEAISVKNELDGYHGRAQFNDRNIEDILSILTFNVLGGKRSDKNKLDKMNRAIARTIELSCSVTHPGVLPNGSVKVVNTGPDIYRSFWRGMFDLSVRNGEMPTIITFNYDLVLERSLFQVLNNTIYHYDNEKPFNTFSISYSHDRIPNNVYALNYVNYDIFHPNGHKTKRGTKLNIVDAAAGDNHADIEILKLHGSLNFPRPRVKFDKEKYDFVSSLNDPYILPPIFNKMSDNLSEKVWETALKRLRESKNIVIVGYSLPRTDIYMQYFLKAALGPNVDLNKITVFDPVLHRESTENNEMRLRYNDCFAPQLHSRIQFRMTGDEAKIGSQKHFGTGDQFVHILRSNPDSMFF